MGVCESICGTAPNESSGLTSNLLISNGLHHMQVESSLELIGQHGAQAVQSLQKPERERERETSREREVEIGSQRYSAHNVSIDFCSILHTFDNVTADARGTEAAAGTQENACG